MLCQVNEYLKAKIMKKYILSPLCSAFIIPGLGQILNNQLKKGLIILAIVFTLFVAGTIKLALIIDSFLEGQVIDRFDYGIIIQRLQEVNFSVLWLLIVSFGIVWLYSVLDAFLVGRRIDKDRSSL